MWSWWFAFSVVFSLGGGGDFNGLECAGGCGLVFWGSRWHSRFGLVLSATLGGLLAFGLASALRCLLRKLFGLLVLSLASAIC
jgi:hypothetical protein